MGKEKYGKHIINGDAGECIIDWEAEEEDDEDEYGPYATPRESRKRERDIDREHARRLKHYQETGEWD